MAKMKLKKNDLVIVKAGRDKGKTGKILKVDPETNRVIVEKVNFVKQFVRADRGRNVQGGVMEKEASLDASKLMIYCEECGQGVRIRAKLLEDGSRLRVCSKCESVLEKPK